MVLKICSNLLVWLCPNTTYDFFFQQKIFILEGMRERCLQIKFIITFDRNDFDDYSVK